MLYFQYFFPFLLFFFLKIQISNAFGYCVDALCSFKCCQDFYTCAISSDCKSSYQSYKWPYAEGSACGGNSDCESDCCNSSQCKSTKTCAVIKAVIGGVVGLIFVIIVGIAQMVIRRRRKKKEEQTYDVLKIHEKTGENETEASSVIANNENFDAKNYCQEKLEMNMGGEPIHAGEMPCKPKAENPFITNFKITT